MTQIPLDIDRVVREVLAELKRAPASIIAAAASSSSNGISAKVTSSEPVAKAPASIPSGNGELVLSTRLVTMAEIEDRLAGIRRVVVNPQAVVTPAVRDALRQRNITLSRAALMKDTPAKSLRLVIVAARPRSIQPTGRHITKRRHRKFNANRPIAYWTPRIDWPSELAKGDSLGLLLTPHTAAAMCLANRLSGVRAVLGSNASNVERDANAVGANLLVIDPKNISLFKLCRMASEFYRGGIRSCPEALKKRLM